MQKDMAAIDLSGLLRQKQARAKPQNGAELKPPALASYQGRTGLCDWQFKRVIAYLSDQIDSAIRVSDLAAEVNLSPGHFARAFSIRLNMSPYSFIMKLRVERARTLLLATDKSLAEIAFNCGLADQAHLSRLFRRFEGMSPSQFRRQQSEKGKRNAVRVMKAKPVSRRPSEGLPCSIPPGTDLASGKSAVAPRE